MTPANERHQNHSADSRVLEQLHYITTGGVRVQRSIQRCHYPHAIAQLRTQLDTQRGVLLSSSFEFPGRYTRWDIGFVNPPLVITARDRIVVMEALNVRGEILLPEMERALRGESALANLTRESSRLTAQIIAAPQEFAEESRSRQPSVFSVLRALVQHFGSERDAHLGLYGAFAYDLAFQFESVVKKQNRDSATRDMVLYLPDEILVADHHTETVSIYRYEFVCRRTTSESEMSLETCLETTGGFRRTGLSVEFTPALHAPRQSDHSQGEYADIVRRAKEYFRRGDLFEVVPGQVFHEPCKDKPSEVFTRLQKNNPAPYGALMNLGEQEYLLAASPEMYVRVRGRRIETCPISGTIARGVDAIGDARQILELLNSEKDEAELSMCTDVDRNDKSRVCVPGSVRVIGRRQVELYSRLIHTVDHVEGTLLPEYDALDGFLSHTWAVTVTGAPKQSAMQFIEDHEKSPRLWYGGAIGCIGFDGNLNTGLTLRAARIKNGIAQVRVGATLLMDSDPEAEETETRLKASAVLAAVRGTASMRGSQESVPLVDGADLKVLMVDHRDSFVHNLASYFREHGVQLQTLRPALARQRLQSERFDLVILSPGPGRPDDFGLRETLALCEAQQVSVFGVCLGLQGIVEYCGGELGVLDVPVHGKPSTVQHDGSALFTDVPAKFTAGRYHSLHALRVPDCLRVTATTEDGVIMAVEHRALPLLAVQFHPESILSLDNNAGQRLVANVVQYARSHRDIDAFLCKSLFAGE
ncbi:MAG: anthranilate synthase component I [Gammaproteobacteria bacterium]|nr:anthranilate synthase component I [Gammaproteobacteria bacterium]MDP2347971.1 anthranilate synthase component I [Gammaproteobacteria bacterium]